MKKPGSRVFAILKTEPTKKEVYLFGYGVYQGDEIPPEWEKTFREEASIIRQSWADNYAAYDKSTPEHIKKIIDTKTDDQFIGALREAGIGTSPKIQLDNGDIVWGYQCWWGEEENFKDLFGDWTIKVCSSTGRASGS